MPTWIATSASTRTRRRFDAMVMRSGVAWPEEWAGDDVPDAGAASAIKVASSEGLEAITRTEQHNEEKIVDETAPIDASGREPNIFIVHGRELPAVRDVRTFVARDTGIMPVSLADEPGQGDTIIEKFENSAKNATFAIVLLTPDDVGRAKTDDVLNDRARQNVVLELGYFFAKLGRRNVAVLNAGVESPSDINGLSYIQYPDGNWQYQLSRELQEAGFGKK